LVNIDLLVRILVNSIFHPFIAALIPLCLLAGRVPYTEPAFRNTVYWAIFICILHALQPISERVAFGQERVVDPDNEIVVITGGASGLGRCLAEMYAMKGTAVAVLDINDPGSEGLEGVEYFRCDISDPEAIERAWKKVSSEVGTPTVLINNAGIVVGKKLLDLTTAEVEKCVTTGLHRLHALLANLNKDVPRQCCITLPALCALPPPAHRQQNPRHDCHHFFRLGPSWCCPALRLHGQ